MGYPQHTHNLETGCRFCQGKRVHNLTRKNGQFRKKSRKSVLVTAVATIQTREKQIQQVVDSQQGKMRDAFGMFFGTKQLTGSLLNNILFWKAPSSNSTLQEVDDVEEFQENVQVAAREVAKLEKQLSESQLPQDIFNYLKPVATTELRYVRIMSLLTSLTYNFGRLTSEKVYRLLKFELVTTSRVFMTSPGGASQSAQDVIYDGDGMCVHHSDRINPISFSDPVTQQNTEMAMAKIQQIQSNADTQTIKASQPEDKVSVKVEQAFDVTKAVNVVAPESSSTNNLAVAASTTMNFLSNAIFERFQKQPNLDQQSASNPSQKNSTIADKRMKSQTSPCCTQEWFVCDDPRTNTRFFVIQGSVSFASWQANLQFDPVVFEDPALGAKIHRGVYEVAEQLYELLLPLVEDHLTQHPYGKLSFSGHSLGGAIATALMLMFRHRQKIAISAFAPAFTFGGTAIFCEGAQAGGCGACSQECLIKQTPNYQQTQKLSLIQRLGFSTSAVKNVVMTHDIVPRAFACDYSLVADFMKSWGQSFREHGCLNNSLGSSRKQMYSFAGEMMVLQPHESASFVAGDGYHPLFPNSPDLYLITDPDLMSQVSMQALKEAKIRQGKVFGDEAKSAKDAVSAFMDTPHPLDILSDPGAYGNDGRISRYHNPNHYTRSVAWTYKKRTQRTPKSTLDKLKKDSMQNINAFTFKSTSRIKYLLPNILDLAELSAV